MMKAKVIAIAIQMMMKMKIQAKRNIIKKIKNPRNKKTKKNLKKMIMKNHSLILTNKIKKNKNRNIK